MMMHIIKVISNHFPARVSALKIISYSLYLNDDLFPPGLYVLSLVRMAINFEFQKYLIQSVIHVIQQL
jgi:hypothetical protein